MTWAREINDGANTAQPGEWDKVTFGDVVCPGIAEVSLKLSADIDKRKAKGVKKSRAIDRGTKPAKLSIRLTLTAGQLEEFRSKIVPLLFPKGKDTAQDPIQVSHPECDLWGIHLFIIEDVDSSAPGARGGFKVISIDGLEWVAAPAEVKPKQTPKPEADTEKKNDLDALPETALDRMLTG